jgi:hypothetical protein
LREKAVEAAVIENHPHDDDPKRLTSARKAAEALFTPKRHITEQVVSDSPLPRNRRASRVRAASFAVSVRPEEVDAPVGSKQPTVTDIPMSQFAGIRALGEHGMAIPQIARVYGAGVGAIERVLQKT